MKNDDEMTIRNYSTCNSSKYFFLLNGSSKYYPWQIFLIPLIVQYFLWIMIYLLMPNAFTWSLMISYLFYIYLLCLWLYCLLDMCSLSFSNNNNNNRYINNSSWLIYVDILLLNGNAGENFEATVLPNNSSEVVINTVL